MVKFATQRSQTRFYIAKAISISELGEGHRQVLIPTRKASRSRISAVPSDTTAKLAIWQKAQQLREDRAALVHEPLSAACQGRFWSQSPFKSRQGKKRRKTLRFKALRETAKYFAGH
jgi:hypothetical protein